MTSTATDSVDGRPRDAQLIDRMAQINRQIGALEAELASGVCEFIDLRRSEPVDAVTADRGKVLPGEFAADEVAAALRCSTHRVQTLARRFRRLRADMPKTAALWVTGAIDGFKAAKIVEAANRLVRPESVTRLDEQAAVRAADDTASGLQQWLNRRVASLEPDAAERRHRRARADRRVSSRMDLDGMGSLWMMAGAADVAAIDSRLTDLARRLGADDPRTMDQRRTDLAVDLLLGHGDGEAKPSGSAAVVMTVPIQSLMGLDDTPGELADRSASIPAPFVRDIAARPGTLFYRAITDPRGHLLDLTELGRFPSDLLGLAIDVRDGTCRWPTCSVPAARCDCDHTTPSPDGPTAASNLGPASRRHHRGKTADIFDLEQPEPGVFVWTTPTGHRYVAEPDPLPVGKWPAPTIVDEHTPIADLIDIIDRLGPRVWESDIRAGLDPRTGPDPLLRWQIDALAAGPADDP
jgi:hypothetical protein